MDNFIENGEWILYDMVVERVGDGLFEYIYFKLYFECWFFFFIINFFILVVLLVFLNCMVFLLLVDFGERIGYVIMCLLVIIVYLIFVFDIIFKFFKFIFVLIFVLMVLLILFIFICFLIIIGFRFYFWSEWKFLLKWFCRFIWILWCKKIRK